MPEGISFIFDSEIMTIRTQFNDKDLGRIYVLARSNARRIIMRAKSDGIYVTASPFIPLAKIKEVIESSKSRLLDLKKGIGQQKFYDFHYVLETDCMRLHLEPSGSSRFMLTSRPGEEIIHCPSDTDFSAEGMQDWLHKIVCEALRRQARIYLPERLRTLSRQCGLPFNKVGIRGSRSRWGSCSSQKNISLSYYLMILPSRLIDAVLIHELCHTVEMNHGPRFWALMNTHTAGEALRLTAELKQYKTDI